MKANESYAGTYKLVSIPGSAWLMLLKNGREIGAWCGRGGVYNAANHFGV